MFCCEKQYARVAQRWSTSLPRRGSRVRSPSRARTKKEISEWISLFCSTARRGIEPAKGAAFFFNVPIWAPIYPNLRLSCLLGYVEMSYVSYFPVLASFRIQNTSLRILFLCFSRSLGYEKCFCISYFPLFPFFRIRKVLLHILFPAFPVL